jgi:hypothetical protein
MPDAKPYITKPCLHTKAEDEHETRG